MDRRQSACMRQSGPTALQRFVLNAATTFGFSAKRTQRPKKGRVKPHWSANRLESGRGSDRSRYAGLTWRGWRCVGRIERSPSCAQRGRTKLVGPSELGRADPTAVVARKQRKRIMTWTIGLTTANAWQVAGSAGASSPIASLGLPCAGSRPRMLPIAISVSACSSPRTRWHRF